MFKGILIGNLCLCVVYKFYLGPTGIDGIHLAQGDGRGNVIMSRFAGTTCKGLIRALPGPSGSTAAERVPRSLNILPKNNCLEVLKCCHANGVFSKLTLI